MKNSIIYFGLLAGMYLLASCNSSKPEPIIIDYKKAEEYIINSEKEWAAAISSGDSTIVERILADDFVGIDPYGNEYNKQKKIEEARAGTKYYKSNHQNDIKVRFYDNTAIAQGTKTWNRYTGDQLKGRFIWTDTWLFRNNKWQIIASEEIIDSNYKEEE